MTETQREEITPDQLMEPFQSRGLKSIIVFTVAVHAVVLIGTSIPFLWKSVAGGDQFETHRGKARRTSRFARRRNRCAGSPKSTDSSRRISASVSPALPPRRNPPKRPRAPKVDAPRPRNRSPRSRRKSIPRRRGLRFRPSITRRKTFSSDVDFEVRKSG